MLRNIALLALALAVVPVAHAQQAGIAVPTPASQPTLIYAEVPSTERADSETVASSQQVSVSEGNEATVARESARNIFALIGVIVVIVALIALLG